MSFSRPQKSLASSNLNSVRPGQSSLMLILLCVHRSRSINWTAFAPGARVTTATIEQVRYKGCSLASAMLSCVQTRRDSNLKRKRKQENPRERFGRIEQSQRERETDSHGLFLFAFLETVPAMVDRHDSGFRADDQQGSRAAVTEFAELEVRHVDRLSRKRVRNDEPRPAVSVNDPDRLARRGRFRRLFQTRLDGVRDPGRRDGQSTVRAEFRFFR